MSETQIYKWWWDQTRKRMKKLKNCSKDRLSVELSQNQDKILGLAPGE